MKMALKGIMLFVKTPRTLCNRIAITIISCSLIMRVLSIGYAVGGFVLKYHEHLLSAGSIDLLNTVSLGSLPVGSFLNALFLSLIPSIIVHSVNAAIMFFGICKESKRCLIASAVINFTMVIFNIIVIALQSWLLEQLYSDVMEPLRQKYYEDNNNFQTIMHCCGFDQFHYMCPYSYRIDCNSYIADTINTYSSSYIAVLVTNVIVSVIMIIGTEYLHRFQIARSKSKTSHNLRNVIDKSELHKLKNGLCSNLCSLLKAQWSGNKLTSCFGYLTFFSMILEGGMILAILFIRYNHHDLTLTTELYEITREFHINIGYIKDALLIAVICLLVWSIIAKSLHLIGVYTNRTYLFVINLITEIVLLTAECVILIFASYLLRALYCCFWNDIDACQFSSEYTTQIPMCVTSWTNAARFIWCSTGILIFHILLKILSVGMADRVFKYSLSTFGLRKGDVPKEKSGFFLTVFVSMKRHPLISTIVGLSILLTVVDVIYFCGLLVIRYGIYSYTSLRNILAAISHGPLNMSTNRDSIVIMTLAVTGLSFVLQVGKFISLGLEKPKITLLILWIETIIISLLIAGLGLISVQVKLVVCCSTNSDSCLFTYNEHVQYYNRNASDLFCDRENPNVLDAAETEAWLMLGFTIFLIMIQAVCIILGYIHYKRSPDGHLSVFKGVVELFKSMWFEITNNRFINEKTMPNYRKQFGIFCVLTGFIMILELAFAVSLYVYYFTEGDNYEMLRFLNRFTFYRYNMEYVYKGVAYAVMVIIPLDMGLRVTAFCWLFMKRTTIAIGTILGISLFWTVGEVVVLQYASYTLHLAYDCLDSFYSFNPTPSRSTLCAQYSSRIYRQCGVIIGYLVAHIILNIGMVLLLDAMYPHIKRDDNTNRLSKRLWIRLREIKKQSIVTKIYIGVQTFSLIINAAFWIGLIVMGLIPGYIHTKFIDESNLCITASNKKVFILGTAYALTAVVPLSSFIQIVGIFGVIKQKKLAIKLYIVFSVIFTLVDFVCLVFSSMFLDLVCKEAGAYFKSSWVLVSYLATTIVLHITSLICSIKISRGRTTRIGVSEETRVLTEATEMTHVTEEHGLIQNQTDGMKMSPMVEENGPLNDQLGGLAMSIAEENGPPINQTGGKGISTSDDQLINQSGRKETSMAEENSPMVIRADEMTGSMAEENDQAKN